MARSVVVGAARVDFTGRTANLEAAAKKGAMQLRDFGRRADREAQRIKRFNAASGAMVGRLKTLATAAAGVFTVRGIAGAAAYGAQLVETARRIGATVPEYQRLERAFTGDGIAAEKVVTALERMDVAFSEGRAGVGEYADAFESLSLDLERLGRLSVEDRFVRIANAIGQVADQADRVNIGRTIFGRTGGQIADIAAQGDIGANVAAGAAAFVSATQEAAQGGKDAAQAFSDLGVSLKNFGLNLLETLGLFDLAEELANRLRDGVQAADRARSVIGERLEEAGENIGRDLAEIVDGIRSLVTGAQRPVSNVSDEEAARLRERYGVREPVAVPQPPAIEFGASPATARVGDAAALAERTARAFAALVERGRGYGRVAPRSAQSLERAAEPVVQRLEAQAKAFEEAQIAKAEQELEVIEELTDKILERRRIEARETERLEREAARMRQRQVESLSREFSAFAIAALRDIRNVDHLFLGMLANIAQQLLRTTLVEPLAGAAGSFLQSLFLGGARAEGGPVAAGRTYLVGEEGPELFQPRSDGQIVPNDALRGAGDVTVNFSPTIQSSDGPGVRAALRAALPDLVATVRAAVRDDMANDAATRRLMRTA